MASGNMHHLHNYLQPSTCFLPAQTSPLQAHPYPFPLRASMATNYQSYTTQGQPTFDVKYHYTSAEAGYTNMSNSALVDAALNPASNKQEHQRDRRASAGSSLSHLPQAAAKPPRRLGSISIESMVQDEDMASIETQQKAHALASSRRTLRAQKRKSVAEPEVDDEYIEDGRDSDHENIPPARKNRRAGRPRKSPITTRLLSPTEDGSPPHEQETKSKKTVAAKKGKKTRPVRLIRKKPIGIPVPKSLSEAGPADLMMWQWKNQGKNWEEIRAEWKRITGVEPGGSSLSVRYIKLNENLAHNGAAGDIELLQFKREVEEEQQIELWARVAQKMLTFSPESEHNPKDLQKRFNMLARHDYNVESLAALDRVRQEGVEKSSQPFPQAADRRGAWPTLQMKDLYGYDNQIANETAARLREHTGQGHDPNVLSHSEEELPSLVEDSITLFEPESILRRQVDGLNEQRVSNDVECQSMSGRDDIGCIMSGATILTTSPYGYHKVGHQVVGQPSLLMNNLVRYNSDSE